MLGALQHEATKWQSTTIQPTVLGKERQIDFSAPKSKMQHRDDCQEGEEFWHDHAEEPSCLQYTQISWLCFYAPCRAGRVSVQIQSHTKTTLRRLRIHDATGNNIAVPWSQHVHVCMCACVVSCVPYAGCTIKIAWSHRGTDWRGGSEHTL